jgi:hypothetical protein
MTYPYLPGFDQKAVKGATLTLFSFLTGSTGLTGYSFFRGFRMKPRKTRSALAERQALDSITEDLFHTLALHVCTDSKSCTSCYRAEGGQVLSNLLSFDFRLKR